jgi:AcrR family transcriptional regulator
LNNVAARIPKAERTRRQILIAAERRFAEAGFENTRLDDIADDIGMVGSAILYHFADKRELYRAVRDGRAADLLAAVDHAVAAKAPPRERLVALVRASARAIATRPGLAGIALREAMSSDRGAERRTNPLLGRIVALFEEGVRTGDIQPVGNEPYHFFSAVAGTILFYVAALPHFVADLPEDHLSADRMEMLESDAVAIAERLLGMSGPVPSGPHAASPANPPFAIAPGATPRGDTP